MDPRVDYCPNIIFNQPEVSNRWTNYTLPLAGHRDLQLREQELNYFQHGQGKRGHSLEPDYIKTIRNPVIDRRAQESLGDETSSLFREAFFSSSPRKKSKLSERLVEKLR